MRDPKNTVKIILIITDLQSLPVLTKVFQKITLNQLSTSLNNNNIIYKNHYDIRSGYSKIDAATELIEHIIKELDKTQSTAGVF